MVLNNTKKISEQVAEVLLLLSNKYMSLIEEGGKKQIDIKEELYAIAYKYYANATPKSSSSSSNKLSVETIKEKLGIKENEVWDKGWAFVNSSESYARMYGEYLVNKGDEYKLVSSGTFIETDEILEDKRLVDLKIRLIEKGDGWFYINSSIKLTKENLIRFYFTLNKPNDTNIEKIFSFLYNLRKSFEEYLIPFQFKFEENFTERYDNLVLYCPQQQYHIAFILIRALSKKYETIFRNDNPRFTKVLAKNGVSFAEDPDIVGESFGMNRSIMFLNIIYKYFNESNQYRIIQSGNYIENFFSKSKDYVEKTFSKENLENSSLFFIKEIKEYLFHTKSRRFNYDIEDCFFRKPNSFFNYDFTIFDSDIEFELPSTSNDIFVKKAHYIGKLLCKNAIVIRNKNQTTFNWINAEPNSSNSTLITYTFIDESFEYGKLGVLYFLSKLIHRLRIENKSDCTLEFFCNLFLESEFKNSNESWFLEACFINI